MIEVLPFCDNWPNYRVRTTDERKEYVAEEMRRVQKERGPLLRVVLAATEEAVQKIALGYLVGDLTPSGEQPVIPTVTYLRLRDGAQPPTRDPQGRVLPQEISGKVLRAKVGNVVHDKGRDRRVADQTGRNLYILRDVASAPAPFALTEAITILRQWGYGVAREVGRQIVEEVDPSALAPVREARPRPERSSATA